jgi:dihydrofolate synthase/folylpolyglutamate synthase
VVYSESIQFLYRLNLFGARFGLEDTLKLAAFAGNPQAGLRFIHVAGTNGKGSTCAMLESIYRAAGLRVGLYTSPHLVSFRERIQVNRQLIPETEVVRLIEELRPALSQFPPDQQPTFFEFVTVMALKFFAAAHCDLVIWETGLGGRLDATNIVTPLAGVITNIALEHTQWLGETLEKIAAEKAGIIKPGIPVVTAVAETSALAVIEKIATEKGAPLTRVSPLEKSGGPLDLPLLGEHQQINAALALATVEVLQSQIPVTKQQIQDGLQTVNWPGRLQLINPAAGPRILLDGAHNAAGAVVLRETLLSYFPDIPRILVLGVLQDKNWKEICGLLAPLAQTIYIVPIASERTGRPDELAAACREASPATEAIISRSLKEAFEVIHSRSHSAGRDELVVVAGSLYLVGEALELLGLSPVNTGERGLNEWTAVPTR